MMHERRQKITPLAVARVVQSIRQLQPDGLEADLHVTSSQQLPDIICVSLNIVASLSIFSSLCIFVCLCICFPLSASLSVSQRLYLSLCHLSQRYPLLLWLVCTCRARGSLDFSRCQCE